MSGHFEHIDEKKHKVSGYLGHIGDSLDHRDSSSHIRHLVENTEHTIERKIKDIAASDII